MKIKFYDFQISAETFSVLDDDSPKTLLKMLRRSLMIISIDEFDAREMLLSSGSLLLTEAQICADCRCCKASR